MSEDKLRCFFCECDDNEVPLLHYPLRGTYKNLFLLMNTENKENCFSCLPCLQETMINGARGKNTKKHKTKEVNFEDINWDEFM